MTSIMPTSTRPEISRGTSSGPGSLTATPSSPFLAGPSIPLAPGTDFPTYLGNVERTSSASSESLIDLTTAPSLHFLWSNNTGGQAVQSQVVEQNGIAYFGDHSGYESAVYMANGTLLWKTYLGRDTVDPGCPAVFGVTATPTVVGATLYVDGGYPSLYALNSSTGAVEWNVTIGGSDSLGFYDWASPLIYDDRAYIGIASKCDDPLVPAGVDEFNLTTHALVNYFNSSAPGLNGSSIWGSASINPDTNTIFVTTGNPHGLKPTTYSESVVALNATTLVAQAKWQVPKWQVRGDGDFGVTPTLFTPAGGYPMLTAADKNGYLYALYQSNLTLAWEYKICCQMAGQDEHISTSWGGGYVYALSSSTTVNGGAYNSSVRAFDPLTGAVVWARGLSQSSMGGYAAPLWVNDLLIVDDGSTLFVFNATSGATLYQDTVGGQFVAAPSISRGEIFAGSTEGIFAFDLSLASTATQAAATGPAPFNDSFNVTGSGGLPPYRYLWNFGDGTTNSTAPSPTHSYYSPGTYLVTVSVTDLAGSISTRTLGVEVGPGMGNNVTFTDTGLPRATLWSVGFDGLHNASTTSSIGFAVPSGTFSYTVESPAGYSASSGSVTVDQTGQTVPVTFDPLYSVTFEETGLPVPTSWTVTWSPTSGPSTNVSSSSKTVEFSEPNGTYTYSIAPISGLHITVGSYRGTVTVNGASPSTISLNWTEVMYPVTFSESGLPAGASWSVNVTEGPTLNGTGSTLATSLSNGTYLFTSNSLGNLYGPSYTPDFIVSSGPASVKVTFSIVTYAVSFHEKGLPARTSWSMTVGPTTANSTSGIITFAEPNGTYAYTASVSGSGSATGSVTVNGGKVLVTVGFYKVMFTESGLPGGTNWSVTTNDVAQSSTTSEIIFDLANGSYPYEVGSISGYKAAKEMVGSVTVSGKNPAPVPVHWTQFTYAVKFIETGLPSSMSWSVMIDGQTKSGTGKTITFSLPNGTFPFTISATGYTVTSVLVNPLVVDGTTVILQVTFEPG
ncbi:MAG: PQQ-binding-like beta-propeller repeat protein [Thermoplasmata archaeon]